MGYILGKVGVNAMKNKGYIYPFLAMAGTLLAAFAIVDANLRFCTGEKKKKINSFRSSHLLSIILNIIQIWVGNVMDFGGKIERQTHVLETLPNLWIWPPRRQVDSKSIMEIAVDLLVIAVQGCLRSELSSGDNPAFFMELGTEAELNERFTTLLLI